MSQLAARLNLKHLRLIAALAEHRQVSLAAHALHITQPAASRTLAEVESLIGAPLFDRHPRGLSPTVLGASLARRARSVIEELADAAEEVDQMRLGRGGVVRIGAVTGAAVGYVVPAIRRLKALAPDVELHVQVATSEELVGDLVALRLDMVLARLPADANPADFRLQRARGEQVRIVAHAQHPLAARAALSLADLGAQHWVMQGPGTPIRRAVEEAMLTLGAPLPRNVTNTASLLVVLALLRDADTVTPISAEVAGLLTGLHTDLVQLAIAEPIAVAPYALVTLRDRRLTPAAARCHALLSDVLAA